MNDVIPHISKEESSDEESSEEKIWIGLDMSLCSPAMAIYRQGQGWNLFAFAQRVREAKHFRHPKIKLFPSIPNTEELDVVRYNHILRHLFSVIDAYDASKINLFIEGYAYQAEPGHSSKLYELGGALRHGLLQRSIPFTVLAPTEWKKGAFGKGFATKSDIVTLVKESPNGPQLDLVALFGVKPEDCPVQDLADACGIVLSQLQNPKKKKRVKKKDECKKKQKKSKSKIPCPRFFDSSSEVSE